MPPSGQSPAEQELARLVVTSLQLEVDPGSIAPEDRLFGEGLGLDSIDALELSLAISRAYGIELKSDDENIDRIPNGNELADYFAIVSTTGLVNLIDR